MSALTTHTYSNPRETKRKEKKRIIETPKSDRKPKKHEEQDHLKKKSLGPLRQWQRLNTSETKLCSSKEHEPSIQSSKKHKEPPLHTCKLPLNQCNSPWTNACKPLDENRAVASAQLWMVRPVDTTGKTGAQHVNRTSPLTGQTSDHGLSDQWHTEPRNGSKPPENLLDAFNSPKHDQTSPPHWQCLNQAKMQKM
jgi:hypothetical protein